MSSPRTSYSTLDFANASLNEPTSPLQGNAAPPGKRLCICKKKPKNKHEYACSKAHAVFQPGGVDAFLKKKAQAQKIRRKKRTTELSKPRSRKRPLEPVDDTVTDKRFKSSSQDIVEKDEKDDEEYLTLRQWHRMKTWQLGTQLWYVDMDILTGEEKPIRVTIVDKPRLGLTKLQVLVNDTNEVQMISIDMLKFDSSMLLKRPITMS